MIKLLFISPHGNQIYGGEKSLLLLLRELRSRGTGVSVICPEVGGFIDTLKSEGIETHLVPLHELTKRTVFKYITSLFHLLGIVKKVNPDIIHCNSASVAQYAAPVAKLYRIPIVVHLRNDLSVPQAKKYLVTTSDAVIANSSFTGSNVRLLMSLHKWHVIYNPIEPLELSGKPQKDNKLVVLFVGQVCAHKGVDVFIKTAELIKDKFKNVMYVIVGDEPAHAKSYMQKMRTLVKDLGIENMIQFTGHVNEVSKYYSTATLVVVPSKKEPFGRVAAESMMAGLPVVASNVGGLPEIVVNNQTGFLVEPEDLNGFAEKIGLLLNDPDNANKMGQAGKTRAISKFSVSGHADNILRIYKNLLTYDN